MHTNTWRVLGEFPVLVPAAAFVCACDVRGLTTAPHAAGAGIIPPFRIFATREDSLPSSIDTLQNLWPADAIWRFYTPV